MSTLKIANGAKFSLFKTSSFLINYKLLLEKGGMECELTPYQRYAKIKIVFTDTGTLQTSTVFPEYNERKITIPFGSSQNNIIAEFFFYDGFFESLYDYTQDDMQLLTFKEDTGLKVIAILEYPDNEYITRVDFNVPLPHVTSVPATLPRNITNLSNAFYGFAELEDINISNWDVSNVTNMSNMFSGCTYFNHSLNDWDVSNVIDMSNMFLDCSFFNKPLNKWNVSNVKDTSGMFKNCTFFNSSLANWQLTSLVNATFMFGYCKNFNQNLNTWKVSPKLKVMTSMFDTCTIFNSPLSTWDTSGVTSMNRTFSECANFNQPLNSWKVSSVTNLNSMFSNCKVFNQPLPSWQTQKVKDMNFMFSYAINCVQDYSMWSTASLTGILTHFAQNVDTITPPIQFYP